VRLTSIKLAGFKSFVDPTHFHVPGQLVGVVGPNGCGKSNIIDAVRWVLGESRASELRGESMQDVIFNGSTNRKPGSRASVELVFDNHAQRAGGQWGQYGEISVKRVLTRDGTSSYYINNLPARRRDIQDIFLGTGLGPRAYAIIGQGMISRIIEAKPEDLRVFLEEAAGVSKYKERRRETENRLHDTRENLTRVEDIVRELSANLQKLESQAEVAARYRDLQLEGEDKQRTLWLLRQTEAEAEQIKHQRAIEMAQNDVEMQTARLREIELELETLRVAHYAASDTMQTAQAALYEANAEVSKIEAEIRFIIDARNRTTAQIGALEGQRQQWHTQSQEARADIDSADEALAMAQVRSEQAQVDAQQAAEALPALEVRWQEAQRKLTDARAQIAQTEQALKLEAAQRRNAEQQLQQLDVRRERLRLEANGLDVPDAAALEEARIRLAEQEAMRDETQARLAEMQETLPRLDAVRRETDQHARDETTKIGQLDARLHALKALQESVQTEGRVQPWLEKHELEGLPRLWKRLQVERGWETAVESVLRERLAALEVSNLEWVKAFAADAPPAKLAFYAPPAAAQPAVEIDGMRPLLSMIRIDDPGLRAVLSDWMAHVFIADDLVAAMAARQRLPEGGCLVVQAGHQVSRSGIALYAADSENAGMLARAQEIDNLALEVRAQSLLADEAKLRAGRAEAEYSRAASSEADVRRQSEAATRDAHALQLEVLKLNQAHERFTSRNTQIGDELEEINAQIEEQRASAEGAEAAFEAHDATLAETQAAFEDQQIDFEQLQQALDNARRQLRERERAAQDAGFDERNLAARIEELRRKIDVCAEQLERIDHELEEARIELVGIEDKTADTGLQEALALRTQRELALATVRTELDALTLGLRQMDESRLTTERSLQPLRDKITEGQLKEQAARLSREQYAEQLEAAGVDVDALRLAFAERKEDWKPSWLQGEVTRINNAIQALGAVNMAALEELTVARERQGFLNAQMEDLTSAITTLEDAIRKIDQETRQLLQGTFNEVNRHFGELFPRLFGGGQAKLVMTGEEILDAGVQVIAQPPGKKNTTIHLLSGGEKALTATALVFAMFQLNPAPFCLLDEVDAPLDDANTERFANLVKAMSDKTQFLFISHNKIAMEMAQQLIGVTMQEQGVSRIVAVDMESAAGFVENN